MHWTLAILSQTAGAVALPTSRQLACTVALPMTCEVARSTRMTPLPDWGGHAFFKLDLSDDEGLSMVQSAQRKLEQNADAAHDLTTEMYLGPAWRNASEKVLVLSDVNESIKHAFVHGSSSKELLPLIASSPDDAAAEEAAILKIEEAAKAVSKAHASGAAADQASREAAEALAAVPPSARWQVLTHVFAWRQEERQRVFMSCSILPVGICLAAVVLLMIGLREHTRRTSTEQSARSLYLTVNFVLTLNYTIVILDSYDLCTVVGLSKGDSGRMVGTYMLGFCIGTPFSWLTARLRPQLWREFPRKLLCLGLCCQLLGSIAYSFVAVKASIAAGKIVDLPFAGLAKTFFEDSDAAQIGRVLMMSRLSSGIGSGVCQQFYVSCMLHLTPKLERQEHTSLWVFSGMLGIGMGPMVAAGMEAVAVCGFWPHFEFIGYAQVLLVLMSLLVVLTLHPSLADVEDRLEVDSSEEEGANPTSGRKCLVLGCLVMTCLRAFGISAIEVAIAMRLEENYHWDQRVTGLAMGCVFLCCIPMKLFHTVTKKALTVVGWVRMLSSLAVMGSGLLFGKACELFGGGCAAVLLMAGAVIFPCFYLSDALGSGLMHQHVLPEGSLLDGNHSQLWYNLFQGMGRFLGPWLARLVLQLSGPDAFALQQLVVTCVFLLGFESFVRPFISPAVLIESTPRRDGPKAVSD